MNAQWFGFLPGADRVAIDNHPYLAFSGAVITNNDPLSVQMLKPCSFWATLNESMTNFGFAFAGEFRSVEAAWVYLTPAQHRGQRLRRVSGRRSKLELPAQIPQRRTPRHSFRGHLWRLCDTGRRLRVLVRRLALVSARPRAAPSVRVHLDVLAAQLVLLDVRHSSLRQR